MNPETLNYILGTILIVASLIKLTDWKSFAERYSTYDIFARRSKVYAYGYPVFELIFGCLYFVFASSPVLWFLTLGLILLNTFSLVQRYQSHRTFRVSTNDGLLPISLPVFGVVESVIMLTLAGLLLFMF